MADEGRCCGGRCCDSAPADLNRRDFIEKIAIGTAALAVLGEFGSAAMGAGAEPGLGAEKSVLVAPKSAAERYPRTAPRVYKGANLEAVAMPIGGIGTGSIWL